MKKSNLETMHTVQLFTNELKVLAEHRLHREARSLTTTFDCSISTIRSRMLALSHAVETGEPIPEKIVAALYNDVQQYVDKLREIVATVNELKGILND